MYAPFDPDRDSVRLPDESPMQACDQSELLRELSFIVDKANYEELPQDDIASRLTERQHGGVVIKPMRMENYHVRPHRTGACVCGWPGCSPWGDPRH